MAQSSRYSKVEIKKVDDGKNKGIVKRNTKYYDKVPERDNDIWVMTQDGDRLDLLANQYYGDPKLWWTIGWFNGKPTEATLKPGDVIYIPRPVSKLLTFLGMGSV